MSEWITDRLPTEADGKNGKGWVIIWDGLISTWGRIENVGQGTPWMPCPPPYIAPPDTSLAASIKAVETWHKLDFDNIASEDYVDDAMVKVIEAARKWDEHEKKGDTTYLQKMGEMYEERNKQYAKAENERLRSELIQVKRERDELKRMIEMPTANDPDGVGEGWRSLRHGELTQPGDVYKNHNGILCEFGPTGWPIGHQTIYRRRIETPPSTDPDGVGEGWRLVDKRKDLPVAGDEWEEDSARNKWTPISRFNLESQYFEPSCRYRRRIETLVPVAGGTADDPYNKKLLDSIQGSTEVFEQDRDWQPDKSNQSAESQGKPREWHLVDVQSYDCFRIVESGGIHVREVNAAMDEWTAKLIELCADDMQPTHWLMRDIRLHMKARPQ